MRRRVSFILPVLLSLLIAGPVRAESDTAGKSADISDRTALLQARREQLAQKRERQFRVADADHDRGLRSEEHTSEPQSLMRIPYAAFCLKKTKHPTKNRQD